MRAAAGRLVAVAVVASAGLSAQTPTLDDVLDRLSTYLADYEVKLTTVAADERFDHRYRLKTGTNFYAIDERQALRSDFIFLRLPGNRSWLGLRDTYLVDGKPTRARAPRVQQLLSAGEDAAVAEAIRIATENGRYTSGPMFRTINVPTHVLDLLQPGYRSRFRFRKSGEESIAGRRLWKIAFNETVRPTLMSTTTDEDVLARGIVWLDPASGAVIRTQLDTDEPNPADPDATMARIVVSYGIDPKLGFLVPQEMTERFAGPLSPFRSFELTTRARYTNFRRFETSGRLITNR
jgi:hypothetical protein